MYQISIGEKTYQVESKKGGKGGSINGQDYQLDLHRNGNSLHILRDNKNYRIFIASANREEKSFELMINGNSYTLQAKDRFDILLAELGMEDLGALKVNDLKAPMPGMVLKIEVTAGSEVKKGDPLLVLEAMKMENILKASDDARIKAIHAEVGKAVEKNQVLIEFE